MTRSRLVPEARVPEEAHPVRRSPRRRALRRAVVAVVALTLLAVAGGVLLLAPAGARLEDAREAMEQGRDALLEGRAARAAGDFERAESWFGDARRRLANPLTRLAGLVPILGRTPEAVSAAAEGGELVARAGGEMAAGLQQLPEGAGSLAPRRGTIPLEPLHRLVEPLGRARDLLVEADRIVRAAPDSWLLAPVAGPMEAVTRQVADTRRTVEAAEAVVAVLPRFLGEDGVRRYFFGAQNPAELRGTGGFLGAFAILTVRDGRVDLGSFDEVQTLPNAEVSEVRSPSRGFAERYNRWGGAAFWPNINMTPDFPSAATAIEALYERVAGVRLDGTILADPMALAAILEGEVDVPGTTATVDGDTVVPFVTNEAYRLLPDSRARKRLLGDMAAVVLGRYLSGGVADDPGTAARALAEAAADGHILLHAADPEVQDAFERAGVSGSLAAPPGDFLAVVVNNAGGNKLDFYADRSEAYRVELGPGGSGTGALEVSFENEAPRRGPPPYVIGPHPGVSRAGENVMITSVYCAPGCVPEGFWRDEVPEGATVEEELGFPVISAGARIPSGGSERLAYRWTAPGIWEGDANEGTYRLTFHDQTTVRETRVEVEVVPPPDMRITGVSSGVRVVEGRAVWSGTGDELGTLEVRFSRPFLSRPVLLWDLPMLPRG